MKWIKSSDMRPPKDKSFLGYGIDIFKNVGVDIFYYREPVLNNRKRVVTPGQYYCECNPFGCEPIMEESMIYWMELPEKPDGI